MHLKSYRGSLPDEAANVLDGDIDVTEFKLQSCSGVHFRTNTLSKVAQSAGAVEYTDCTSSEE